jgi:TPR repeat protein
MYENGIGVPSIDETRAFEAYDKACGAQDRLGCRNLAHMYLDGRGVPQDSNAALKYLGDACQHGEGKSCNDLRLLYAVGGEGIAKDVGRATEHFKQACDFKELEGCSNFEKIKTGGKGVAVKNVPTPDRPEP